MSARVTPRSTSVTDPRSKRATSGLVPLASGWDIRRFLPDSPAVFITTPASQKGVAELKKAPERQSGSSMAQAPEESRICARLLIVQARRCPCQNPSASLGTKSLV
jgi:hypothetical protein